MNAFEYCHADPSAQFLVKKKKKIQLEYIEDISVYACVLIKVC